MALGTLPIDISVVKLRNILICFFLTIFFTNQLLRMKPVIKDFRNKDYYCIGPGLDGEDIKVGHWWRIKRESFLMVPDTETDTESDKKQECIPVGCVPPAH